MTNGNLNGTPPWWVRLIFTYGVSTALVVFGLGVFTGMVPSPLLEQALLAKEHDKYLIEMRAEVRANSDRVLLLLRQICRNTAKNDTHLDNCG